MLTYEDAHRLFAYDPETGVLSRKKAWGHCPVGSEAGVINKIGYRLVKACGKRYPAHRVIMLMTHGELLDFHVDHINGDRADNRLCNLRLVESIDNNRNRAIQSNNTSGFCGVHWYKASKKWQVRIGGRDGRFLGYFDSLLDAVAARKSAELALGFHKNHGRKVCR